MRGALALLFCVSTSYAWPLTLIEDSTKIAIRFSVVDLGRALRE